MLARRHRRSLIPDDEALVAADLDDFIAAAGFVSVGLHITPPPPAVIVLSSWLQVIKSLAVVLCPICVQDDPPIFSVKTFC